MSSYLFSLKVFSNSFSYRMWMNYSVRPSLRLTVFTPPFRHVRNLGFSRDKRKIFQILNRIGLLINILQRDWCCQSAIAFEVHSFLDAFYVSKIISLFIMWTSSNYNLNISWKVSTTILISIHYSLLLMRSSFIRVYVFK